MNIINKAVVLGLLFMGWVTPGPAQQLTVQEVVQQVLHNNFDVQLAQKDVEMAGNSETRGNAGLMPSVQLGTGANYSNNNTEIKFAGSIPPINVNGAENTSYNANLSAGYSVFNGFANIKTYEKLKVAHLLSEEQLQLTLENAIMSAVGLCLDLARLQEDELVLKSNLELSANRLSRIQVARNLGTASSLDLLNAQLDHQTDSIAILNFVNQKMALIRQLNLLMGAEVKRYFQLDVSRLDLPLILLEESLNLAQQNNTAMMLIELRKKSAELDVDIARAATMPQVNLNTAYGFTNSQNAAGIVLEQTNLGFSGGLSISIPIYSGGKIKTAMANTAVQLEKNELMKKQTLLAINKEVYDHWENYLHQLNLQKLESQNVELAKLLEQQAGERFKLGQITSLEYRQAQLGWVMSQNRLNAARYAAQKEAYHLLRLQGKLVNQEL